MCGVAEAAGTVYRVGVQQFANGKRARRLPVNSSDSKRLSSHWIQPGVYRIDSEDSEDSEDSL